MEQKKLDEIVYMQKCKEFKNYFKIDAYKFFHPLMTEITGQPFFDLIAFDEFLHNVYGYSEEKHGSIKDFLCYHFDENVCMLVEDFVYCRFFK